MPSNKVTAGSVPTAYEQVYELVQRIPKGKVLTYGAVSHLLDGKLTAQGVGWALRALVSRQPRASYSVANVPWHRVINASGKISSHKNPDIPEGLQRQLLEKEGVVFNSGEVVDLDSYLWLPITCPI